MIILLYRTIDIFVRVIELAILFRIILSFLNFGMGGFITRLIYEITEPILAPARALLSKLRINTGMFDFSPLLAYAFLRIFESLAKRAILLWV